MHFNRTIWIYWDQGFDHAPDLVNLCIDSWKYFNPDFEVMLIDRRNYQEYIELTEKIDINRSDITVQKVSVFVRLLLLKKYGGVWADATVFCAKSLSEWLPEYLVNGFFAFRNPGPDRMMSNWFMVFSHDNLIINTLSDEFIGFFDENRFDNQFTAFGEKATAVFSSLFNNDFETSVLWTSDLITKGFKIYPYFIFHYLFNKIILENQDCRALWQNSPVFEADKPHLLQFFSYHENSDAIISAKDVIKSNASPVYKLNWRVDTKSQYWHEVLYNLKLLLKS